MPPIAVLERLATASINLIPIDITGHYVFERDGSMALVQRKRDGSFGHVGSAGLLTEAGLAPLVWRGAEAAFVSRSAGDITASPEQIEVLRKFQSDLQRAIHG